MKNQTAVVLPIDIQEDTRTIEERVDAIAAELLNESLRLYYRRSAGKACDEKAEERLVDLQRLFKFIDNTYSRMVKLGRIVPKKNGNFDHQFMQRVKAIEGTIGDIVRNIPTE